MGGASATMKMLLLVMVGLLASGVSSEDDVFDSSCDIVSLKIENSYNPAMVQGRYYVLYRSHTPSYITTFGITSQAVDRKTFADASVVFVTDSFVSAEGSCVYETLVMEVNGGKVIERDDHKLWGKDLHSDRYLVATDNTTTVAMYDYVTVDGQFSPDYSGIVIYVNDPNADPSLEFLRGPLQQFCGLTNGPQRMEDLFVKFNIDASGHENCLGPAS